MKRDRQAGLGAEDWWLGACALALVSASGAMIAVNAVKYHFTGIAYFPRFAAGTIPPLLELVAFAAYARGLSARTAFAVRNYASAILLWAAISVLTTGIQFTPCAAVDEHLVSWDARLHIHVTDLMAWTWSHPWFSPVMRWSYPGLNAELPLVPLLAALSGDRRRMRVFLYAMAYSFFVGGLFYYFFPSSGPASVMQSPYFTWEQLLTGQKFQAVHALREVTTVWGGMVAFPSFHAVWAILLTYAAASRPRLFPAFVVLNGLVIISTVMLGWHFLVDVIASAALAGASLWAGERTHRWLCAFDH